ncbi:hypothetical protein C8F04DRAFT_922199, partial [Mycena alexandri]
NILAHFEELAGLDCPPTLDDLLEHASIIRERYASRAAYDQSLSKAEQEDAIPRERAPTGSPWTKPETDDNPPPAPNPPPKSKKSGNEDGPQVHTESPGFDGDRVLSNAILFLMEFGWWIELNYAIAEGDVGRVMQILKILIFTFTGTSNQNYMGYSLDLYALLEYECSPELKEAILSNWLLNLAGEVGRWIEGDLMQEHYNRWLEDMVKRRGGNFDDKFYCQTLAPNLHLFRSGRSMGHAAVNRFNRGWQRLEGGKLDEFLECSQEYAGLVRDMEAIRNGSES